MTQVLLIPDGAGVRNFLLGRFLQHAAARGPVVTFHQIRDDLRHLYESPGMAVRWQTLDAPRNSRLSLVLRNALGFAHMYWAGTASMRHSLSIPFGGPGAHAVPCERPDSWDDCRQRKEESVVSIDCMRQLRVDRPKRSTTFASSRR